MVLITVLYSGVWCVVLCERYGVVMGSMWGVYGMSDTNAMLAPNRVRLPCVFAGKFSSLAC